MGFDLRMKNCFVIMGYGIKDGLDLDYTYHHIISPCIKENHLKPYPLYQNDEFNAYRCDQITGSTSIDFNFVICLKESDIVIADISTMNVNAIYELGARHAFKKKSTILLCAKSKKREFRFFDLQYVPIVFYDHNGADISDPEVRRVKDTLNSRIRFAIQDKTGLPDNPIQRAVLEQENNMGLKNSKPLFTPSYPLYEQSKVALDKGKYDIALSHLMKLYTIDPCEENFLLLILAKYKLAEEHNNISELMECLNLIRREIDIEHSTSETLFGRMAAISLRIYNILNDPQYYHDALKYYQKGAGFSRLNLYCPKNFCANLLRIHEISDDKNIHKEYCYTAIFYAKFFLDTIPVSATISGSYQDRLYYYYNRKALEAIKNCCYDDIENDIKKIQADVSMTDRQKQTILNGLLQLKMDMTFLKKIISF